MVMKLFTQYKILFFLSVIIMITTIIGEYYRIEDTKEGFLKKMGNPLKEVTSVLKKIGSGFTIVEKIFKWLFSLLFQWLPLFVLWILQYVLCAFEKILNIPNCFLWYSLEIAGKIIYLPFRITFFILDLLFVMFRINFKIQKIVDNAWWFLDDISHYAYEMTGYHIVHYNEDVINKCYKCKIGNFPIVPKFPNL